ncbi:hypothetical protein SF1_21590 [Sphingobacterium faecium NBRC 15299]|nr:hypothetical protein SF1_21590 [Sphingobacterium faecium NBRC 15299]
MSLCKLEYSKVKTLLFSLYLLDFSIVDVFSSGKNKAVRLRFLIIYFQVTIKDLISNILIISLQNLLLQHN